MATERWLRAVSGVVTMVTRSAVLIGAMMLIVASCGGGGVAEETASTVHVDSTTSTVAQQPAEQSAATTGPSTTVESKPPVPEAAPGIAAVMSGRGDDGSLEVGVWFGSNPFTDESTRLIIGTDSDDSYPGTGDVRPHLDAWIDIDESGARLVDGGDIVADDASGDLDELFSWSGPGRVMRLYFIGNVPKRAGTVWVIIEHDGPPLPGAVAGTPFGSECSFHDAGIDLGVVPGDTPRSAPCRYPLG